MRYLRHLLGLYPRAKGEHRQYRSEMDGHRSCVQYWIEIGLAECEGRCHWKPGVLLFEVELVVCVIVNSK
jgi:hypothetical protein